MRQDRVVTQHAFRDRAAVERHVFIQGIDIQAVVVANNSAEQVQHIFAGCCFIKGDANGIMDVAAQVNFQRFGACQHRRFVDHFHAQSVEVVGMAQLEPFFLQPVGQNIGQPVDAAGDALQALWPVEHRVQAGDVCQQYLGSTNIGVRFLATDMLFAGLHRHTQRGVTGGIF